MPAPFSAPCPSRRQCQQDAALWQALRLDQRVPLDELLNISQVGTGGERAVPGCAPHLGDTAVPRPSRLPSPRQYTEEISAAFEEVNITLSPISLLNESQGDLLLNASRAAQPPNFTRILEQVGGLGGQPRGWGQPGVGSGGPGACCGAAVPSALLLWETLLPLQPGGPGSVLPHGDGVRGGEAPLSASSHPRLMALPLPFAAGSERDPGKPPGSGRGAGAAGGQSGERWQHPGATATPSPKPVLRGSPLGAVVGRDPSPPSPGSSHQSKGGPPAPLHRCGGGTADCTSF